jgi:hypothetical protein
MSHTPPNQPDGAPQTVELHTPSYSRLLLLPGELRNRIYEYALTARHGLYMKPGGFGQPPRTFEEDGDLDFDPEVVPFLERGKDLSSECFNQLKFTCHQLYKETAGIEVKFNPVRFIVTGAPGRSAEAFVDFLSDCAPDKAAWFTTITVSGNPAMVPFTIIFDSDWESVDGELIYRGDAQSDEDPTGQPNEQPSEHSDAQVDDHPDVQPDVHANEHSDEQVSGDQGIKAGKDEEEKSSDGADEHVEEHLDEAMNEHTSDTHQQVHDRLSTESFDQFEYTHIYTPPWLKAIGKYCLRNPHVTVNFHLATFYSNAPGFISTGLYYTQLFVGRDLRSEIGSARELEFPYRAMIDLDRWHLRPEVMFVTVVPNLRFWPVNAAFDEKRFRAELRGFQLIDVDACVKLARGWHEHGLR